MYSVASPRKSLAWVVLRESRLLAAATHSVSSGTLRIIVATVFYYLEELQNLADFHLVGIQKQVQVEMKTEAAQRAGKAPAKPGSKKAEPKVKQQEASAAIAKAMQAAEAQQTNDFQELQKVRILRDLRGPGGQLLPTKDRIAYITEKLGDRAWWLQLPQDPAVSLDDMDDAMRWQPSADYTEIQALEESEA
ncbi:hypothetical protein CLU84_1752 [Comamonas sp. 26]|nr:hypothetical protein CLU84_1752 [Comamonas sp. 26]